MSSASCSGAASSRESRAPGGAAKESAPPPCRLVRLPWVVNMSLASAGKQGVLWRMRGGSQTVLVPARAQQDSNSRKAGGFMRGTEQHCYKAD